MSYTVPTDAQLAAAPWMRFALSYLGIAELPGGADNPVIVEWIKACAPRRHWLWHDATPHCSAFVNYCMREAGKRGTGSLAARSWLRWGRSTAGAYGDVVVLWRGAPVSGPVGPGHVGFVDRIEGDTVFVLGGNQRNRVGVDPYPMRRVLGFRGL